MTDEGFIICTKRWTGMLWTPVGLAFFWLALDLKFLHWIPGATEESGSWLVFLILSAIGAGITLPAVRAVLKPRTLLAVSRDGITISAARSRSEWNNETGRMEPVIRYGDERHIPWNQVESVEEGFIERVVESRTRGTVISRTESSTTRVGGHTDRQIRTRPALRILCSREINMDQVSVRNLIHARTGDDPADITSEDRAHFTPEEIADRVFSEFLIDTRLLPAPLDRVLQVMRQLNQA